MFSHVDSSSILNSGPAINVPPPATQSLTRSRSPGSSMMENGTIRTFVREGTPSRATKAAFRISGS